MVHVQKAVLLTRVLTLLIGGFCCGLAVEQCTPKCLNVYSQ